MPFTWTALLVGLAIQFAGYLLIPKPRISRPEAPKDFDSPTSSVGRPVPAIFGEHEVQAVNVLIYGEKSTQEVGL